MKMLSNQLRRIASVISATKPLTWDYQRHVNLPVSGRTQHSAKASHGYYTIFGDKNFWDLLYQPNKGSFEHLGTFKSEDSAKSAAEKHHNSKPAGRDSWDYTYLKD
jgi:hypothetical protein